MAPCLVPVVRSEAACVGIGERACLLGIGCLVCVRGRLLPLGLVAAGGTTLTTGQRWQPLTCGKVRGCLRWNRRAFVPAWHWVSCLCLWLALATERSCKSGWLCVVAGSQRRCLSSQVRGCGSLAEGPICLFLRRFCLRECCLCAGGTCSDA